MAPTYDAVVVGSGPNGLAAAIVLAQAGLRVLVREAAERIGGGLRSEEATLPGFVHDLCSAVHPLAVTSPFFRTLPLAAHGLEWVHPDAPLAHPLDDAPAAVLERSLDATAAGLGLDGDAWRALFAPFVEAWDALAGEVLGPVHLPSHPRLLARFGLLALRSAESVARARFEAARARALFAGNAAHSFLALDAPVSAAFGLLLSAAGHAAGWPVARGGSQRLADALAGHLRTLGGAIETAAPVHSLGELDEARLVLLDLAPRGVLRLAGDRLPARYRRALARYRPGPAAFKLDWALDAPIPWRDPACARGGTVHLGGTLEEVAAAEAAVVRGAVPERPFVLVSQPTLWDATRAPAGRHVGWAYCHVPNGCTVDMTERIERQVERFAPGFRERILARRVSTPADLERRNANLVGGDISNGALDLRQIVARPALRWNPYATPIRNVLLCSAATPPGPGVHGMAGFHAARAALRAI